MNDRYMTIDIKEVLYMVDHYQEYGYLDSKTIVSGYLYNLVTDEISKFMWGKDDEILFDEPISKNRKRYILIGA